MLSYLIISLAVLCFAAQFAFTKSYEGAVRQTAVTSLVMLVITSLAGMLLYLFVGGFRLDASPVSLAYAAALAVIMIPYYTVGIKVISLGSLAVYSMFMMLGGMLVPFLYGIIFLNEEITPLKIVGVLLMSVCIVLQAVFARDDGGGGKRGRKYLFFALCLLIFLVNGLTGVIAKAHQISAHAIDEISFTVISCGLTALFSLALLFAVCLKNAGEGLREVKSTLGIRPLAIMTLIGMAAYTGNFLHLVAATSVPASVQFPLVSGGVMLISALVSRFIFKERISYKEWISVFAAFLSTLLFAF